MISVQECGPAILLVVFIVAIAWLCYNINSVSRAANALERIADAHERIADAMEAQDEDDEDDEGAE